MQFQKKKAKLYNISRTLQASNKKLPLSAFNFVDAASPDAFCLLSSSKVKLFNICCPSRATNAKAFPSLFCIRVHGRRVYVIDSEGPNAGIL